MVVYPKKLSHIVIVKAHPLKHRCQTRELQSINAVIQRKNRINRLMICDGGPFETVFKSDKPGIHEASR